MADDLIEGATLLEARTMHEMYRARLAALRYERERGRLVDRAAMASDMRAALAVIRDEWMMWPMRAAPRMAAELGVDVAAVRRLLDAEVRAQLSALAMRLRGVGVDESGGGG